MAEPGISEDRGFKALFTAYPADTVAVFARSLVAERGMPATVVPLQQEAAPPDLDDPSRFIDIALLATWADGSQAVILLIEHWSEARKVDLRRVAWYTADLLLRHRDAVVQPTILVTEPDAREVSGRLEIRVGARTCFVLDADVVRIGPDDAGWLRGLRNRVAAVLLALAHRDAVEAAVAALIAMRAAPGPIDDLRRFLALIQLLSRMSPEGHARFRARLEEAAMVTVLDEVKAEGMATGLAKGLATGLAKGKVEGELHALTAIIRHMVRVGTLTIDQARTQIEALVADGELPAEVGAEALRRLG